MERTAIIKKRDAVATRAAILAAARQRFLRDSYDNVSLREIAGDAGVDVALISRYFGGKEGLFREVVVDESRPGLFREPQSVDELASFLAQLVAEEEDITRQQRMELFVIMLRSASSPKAGEIIRDRIHSDVVIPLTALLGRNEGEMRADMLLAIVMGLSVLRTIMKVDSLAVREGGQRECAERFRCLFEAALTC